MPTRSILFGQQQPGGALAVLDLEQHPRNVWFVDSAAAGGGDTVGHGQHPDTPFDTLAYAFSSDLMAAGDVCYVMPGHTEAVAAAGTITMDIAGIRVIGLGWGSNRPTFTWTATDATIAVSAASVEIKNILCQVTIDEVVKMWDWTGAYGVMDAVDFNLAEAAEEAIQFVYATSAATDFRMRNCRHHQATAAAANAQWVEIRGARTVIEDNIFEIELTNNAASKIISNGAAAVGQVCRGNVIHAISASCIPISYHASSEGIACDNRVVSTGTLAGKIALGGLSGNENYVATTANKNGILDPVVA